MKHSTLKKLLSVVLCVMLFASLAMMTTGCGSDKPAETTAAAQDSNVLGEGQTVFTFTYTDPDGKETEYEIHTDKKVVGEALLDLGLIAGEDSEYGLYVKTVGGITLDYDKDGKYWAFYVDGAYGETGVDTTEIVAGSTYSFKAE